MYCDRKAQKCWALISDGLAQNRTAAQMKSGAELNFAVRGKRN